MSIWQWPQLQPLAPEQHRITLGEGDTPLTPSRRIGPAAGLANLHFKLDFLNPTGSYKDRFAAAAVSHMLAAGKTRCIATSSGNTGSALAAYCAAAGIACEIAVVEGAPEEKLKQMAAYGAKVFKIKGFGADDHITRQVFQWVDTQGRRADSMLQISAFRYSPIGMAGVQSISYELAQQMPAGIDHVFVPAGGGGLTLAIARGFVSSGADALVGSRASSASSGADAPVGSRVPSASSGADAPVGSRALAASSGADAPVGSRVPSASSGADAPVGSRALAASSGADAPVGSRALAASSGADAPVGSSRANTARPTRASAPLSPRIHCVQPTGNDTMATPLRSGNPAHEVHCTTAIGGLQVPSVLDANDVIAACRATGGTGHIVSDQAVWDMQRRLLREEGIFCEPASAVPVVAALAAAATGEIPPTSRIVCILTGIGFKDMPAIDRLLANQKCPLLTVADLV